MDASDPSSDTRTRPAPSFEVNTPGVLSGLTGAPDAAGAPLGKPGAGGGSTQPDTAEVERFRELVNRSGRKSASPEAGESTFDHSRQDPILSQTPQQQSAALPAHQKDIPNTAPKEAPLSVSSAPEGGKRTESGVSDMFSKAMHTLPKHGRDSTPATQRNAGAASRNASAHKNREVDSGAAVSGPDGRTPAEKGIAPMGMEPRTVSAPAETAASTASSSVSNARCEELVERILVSRPDVDGHEEVRIKLDNSWLPDTEVRMVKTPGAGLSVEFVSDQVDAQRFLMPNLANLRERLLERTGEQVAVRMSEHMGEGGERDGRSRNRRNLYEELGEDR